MTIKHRNPSRSVFASEALMLRALHTYHEARNRAEHDGADVSTAPVPPSFREVSQQYDALLNDWAGETPQSYGDTMAYLDLVAAIVDDERSSQRGDPSAAILSTEHDFGYALTLLTSARRWLNERDIKEAVEQERASPSESRTMGGAA